MWVARFKLKADDDIHSPLCVKHHVDLYAIPAASSMKNNKIDLVALGTMSGAEKDKDAFVKDLEKDKRIKKVERHNDFLTMHAQHPASREAKAELIIFYNSQYIMAKPVHVSTDGWEYWEVACIDREELNKIVQAAIKHYHGELFSMKKEVLRDIASFKLSMNLSDKQLEAVTLAFKEGYYSYPRKSHLKDLARYSKKAFSTFQENLARAENKIIDHFLKYK